MEFIRVIVVIALLILYFVPAIVAHDRKHNGFTAILIANLVFGWTVLGWIVILIWANNSNVAAPKTGPSPDTHVKCPDCAELVKREAKICKHCGCKLIPQ